MIRLPVLKGRPVRPGSHRPWLSRVTSALATVDVSQALFALVVSAAVAGAGVVAYAALQPDGDGGPKDITTTYSYNDQKEQWEKTELARDVQPNPDGSLPKKSNTIIIRLDANNPVKQIIIEEALIIGGTEPILEINGSEAPGTGTINIGALAFLTVNAEQLEIDADVVRTDISNTVAKDNELDLDLDAVNVVRTAGGAASSLYLGIGRADRELKLQGIFDEVNGVQLGRSGAIRDDGLRADRIRILGPSSGTAFVELLVVKQSSVMGKIDVDRVAIQDLILRGVSLDDA